jgi:hypothetical protein
MGTKAAELSRVDCIVMYTRRLLPACHHMTVLQSSTGLLASTYCFTTKMCLCATRKGEGLGSSLGRGDV